MASYTQHVLEEINNERDVIKLVLYNKYNFVLSPCTWHIRMW